MSGYEYATDEDIQRMMGAEPEIRVEDGTAYVQTVRQALEVCDWPGVEFVVIEDNMERIKFNRISKVLGLK